ncbi:MAG: glucuronate isomerase [Turicibacter sp.]|nr:glucuronate isomerase [Turicibacter sp.]
MKKFLGEDFLLKNEIAQQLFESYAKKMPIIDFHNHLSAKEIYENKQFENISQVWLGGDHYKWRAMRTLGVPENLITGNASDEEKFHAWAKSVPYLIGNPLYHWTHMELQRYFNIFETLSEETATEIYAKCNGLLQQEGFRVRGLLEMQQIEVLCTTDDPTDDLKYHQLIAKEEGFGIQVLPTFRPDKAVNIELSWYNDWVDTLSNVVGFSINSLEELFSALSQRMDYFVNAGCKVCDNGLDVFAYAPSTLEEAQEIFQKARQDVKLSEEEVEKYKTQVLYFLGKEYHKRNWVMQLHIGALRNNNTRMLNLLGPDTGYDSINNSFNIAKLGNFLNDLNLEDQLPKTIIYDLNPADNHKVVTLMQCFQDGVTPGKLQFGSGWWFMDQKDGMIDQMKSLAANGVLSQFVGMLTDSRSFLSFPRHEYFRRILCQLLSEYVLEGEYPNQMEFLGRVVEDICYHNSNRYFGFGAGAKALPQLSGKLHPRTSRPIKFLQFGAGNFLRAFVDGMLQEMNGQGIIDGNVAVVQPTPHGRNAEIQKQDGLYTLILEGIQNGEYHASTQVIDVLEQFNNPFTDFEGYLKLAENPDLEFVFSNTTEAGIVLVEDDDITATPAATFPAKVLQFLKHRFDVFGGAMDKGLYFIPCELIDNNGDELHRCVRRLAEINHLGGEFLDWLDTANTFTNTLVDRIVPGYPKEREVGLSQQLGYQDNSMVMGEVFHLWVIEDRNGISEKLPGHKIGLNMVFAKDVKPYKIQKVRILNGLHTLMVPVSYLKGLDTVRESMNDEALFQFINQAVEQELIPATEHYIPKDELKEFAGKVYDRFNNPQVHHELMSIALNATSKFKARLLPTALDYVKAKGEFPKRTSFALASNLVFFRGIREDGEYMLKDEERFLDFYKGLWSRYDKGEATVADIVVAYLGYASHWEQDLNLIPKLKETMTGQVQLILENGMEEALKAL